MAVVHDGAIVHQLRLGFGDLDRKQEITDDNFFWLASVTKTFSAVMLMRYQQEGRLSLEDLLVRYPFASVGFLPKRVNDKVRLNTP